LIFCFVRHNGFSWLTVPETRFYLKYGGNKLGGFAPPPWKAQQVGIVTSQGAQLASDATVYKELQSQAAKLGADAVPIVSSGMRQYAAMPGFANYNATGTGSPHGNPTSNKLNWLLTAWTREFIRLELLALDPLDAQPKKRKPFPVTLTALFRTRPFD
jgi:hypothetical protein